MRYTDIDHQIEALASKQHGAFSRQQAFTVGATDRFVHRRVVQGQWRRVAPGVLVLASSVGTWFRQCKIGELSVEDSAVGGYTAAALHELGGSLRARSSSSRP
jgi:Transcriptional regulator, AbiEi antitoxin